MRDDVISHDKRRHLCQKCSLIPIDVYSTKKVHVNSSANNANYLKFYGQKVKSSHASFFGDYKR